MLEGKIANCFWVYPKCERCRVKLPEPEYAVVGNKLHKSDITLVSRNYIGTPYYIYESKRGAVCYCSKYCRNKHNHRFHRR